MIRIVALALCILLKISTSNAQTLEWAKGIWGEGGVSGFAITTDLIGNVYTTGNFIGTIDFDPSVNTFILSSPSSLDIFISKFDSTGDFIWAKRIGGLGTDRGLSIATDLQNNIYIAGYFNGNVDFNPGLGVFNLSSVNNQNIFILKLNTLGEFLWAKQFSGMEFKNVSALRTDNSGNVYTTGGFKGIVDFDPGVGTFNLTSNHNNDIFISKLDTDGNFIWAKQMGGTNENFGNDISLDNFGNIYTTGTFTGTADFDPGTGVFNLTSNGSSDIFISKLDSGGNFVWAKQIGGANFDRGFSLANTTNGNVYVTGAFRETVDFDPNSGVFNMTSAGTDDIFVVNLDSLGNFVWAKRIGGSETEFATSIKIDSYGSSIFGGLFFGNVDFDPGINVFNLDALSPSGDIYIMKLDSTGDFVWAHQIGGIKDKALNEIFLDNNDNLYATGFFRGLVDFDPSPGVFNLNSMNVAAYFIYKQINFSVGLKNEYFSDTRIFPNPTSGNLTLMFNQTHNNIQIIVRNILGQPVQIQKYMSVKEIPIVLEGASGIYLVEISNNYGKEVFKVVKN